MTRRRINPWITNSFVDSCAFDPKYAPEDEAANAIVELHRNEQLGIQIAHSNQKEIEHPNTPAWVKAEAAGLIYTIRVTLTPNERAMLRRILEILTGTGKPKNFEADARHLFEAQKYGSYFVTTDRRILTCASQLEAACNVDVLLPSEFLALVRRNEKPDR